MRRFVRTTLVVCGILAAGASVAWGTGLATFGFVQGNGTVLSCVNNVNGNVRFIDPTSKNKFLNSCRPGETQVPLASPAAPASVTVNCGHGQTVTQALNNTAGASSVTITVNGTCVEAVNVSRDNVTLQAGSSGSGIQAPSVNDGVISLNNARNVTLQGLTLTGGGTSLGAYSSTFGAQDLHITGAAIGVQLGGGAAGGLDNVSIDSCQTGIDVGYGGSTLKVGGGSIQCQNGVQAESGGSLFLFGGATIHAANLGAFADQGGMISVDQATISNSGGYGVWAQGGSISVGAGTLVTGSGFAGVEASDGGIAYVRGGAQVSGNGDGVDADGGGHLLLGGAVVENNTGNGVKLAGGSTLDMTGSTVHGNGGDGLHLNDTSVAQFDPANPDQITGNGGWGIFCEGAPSVAMIEGGPGTVSGNTTGQNNCPSA